MAHKHSVYDTSTHFIIDGNTRLVKNSTEAKTTLVQYDHNSERITFELPRYIDGHDMSLCTYAQVHYINIERKTNRESTGVYECDDLQIAPDDENVVICSWLISKNATKFVGSLFFVIRFICSEDREVTYSWNTARHTGLSVTDGIYNGEDVDEIVESDAFKIFEETIEAANTAVKNANKAIASANEANEIARGYLYNIQTTTDGKLQLLDADMNVITTIDTFCGDDDTLHRYADGMLSVIGIKERNKDNTYRVWVGTHEEYAALPEIDPSTFYWVNDDNTYEEFVETVNALINDHNSLQEAHDTLKSDLLSGKLKVKKAAECDTLYYIDCTDEDLINAIGAMENSYSFDVNKDGYTVPNSAQIVKNLLNAFTDAFLNERPVYIRMKTWATSLGVSKEVCMIIPVTTSAAFERGTAPNDGGPYTNVENLFVDFVLHGTRYHISIYPYHWNDSWVGYEISNDQTPNTGSGSISTAAG